VGQLSGYHCNDDKDNDPRRNNDIENVADGKTAVKAWPVFIARSAGLFRNEPDLPTN
jgi:hypothetical protein